MKTNEKKETFKKKSKEKIEFLKNNKQVINLINKILEYSAKKIIAKDPLLYSTLKPETNSDSPSAKSKGERLVSARQEVNHIINKGRKINTKFT